MYNHKRSKPFLVALSTMKTENYRAEPARNNLNPETANIILNYTKKLRSVTLHFSKN